MRLLPPVVREDLAFVRREQLRGPGSGQGFGETVQPGPVFVLQDAELAQGRGPPLRPRRLPGRPLLDGDGRPASSSGGLARPRRAVVGVEGAAVNAAACAERGDR